jgi:hypothetical protein
MYEKRHTFPSPMATPTIVISVPNRDANVSRAPVETDVAAWDGDAGVTVGSS